MTKIISRITKLLGGDVPLAALTEDLSPTDLQSLMLHVYRERSAKRSAADLFGAYERTLMLQPSTADARQLVAIKQAAFECSNAFYAVELAPVAPLGINAVLGQIDQNNCLATIRNAEVAADPTTALALEAARRRRAANASVIRLCSCSRMLRLQPFDVPGFSPHFELFAMVSAGRDRGSRLFEMEALREHIEVYLRLLYRLRGSGYAFTNIELNLSDTNDDERLLRCAEAEALQPLAAQHPSVTFRIDQRREQGRAYYSGLCIGLYARDGEGQRLNLGDGGFTQWAQRLLSNAKERLFVSALGVELVAKRFVTK